MHRHTSYRSRSYLSLFILLVVGVGQCCLMWASSMDGPRSGHDHGMMATSMEQGAIVAALGSQPDPCCADTPTLVSKSVSPIKADLALTPWQSIDLPSAHTGDAHSLRAPPNPPGPGTTRAYLQIFLI